MTKTQVLSAKQKLDDKVATIDELAALNDVHPWTLTWSLRRMEESA